jgi:hypothetical protein
MDFLIAFLLILLLGPAVLLWGIGIGCWLALLAPLIVAVLLLLRWLKSKQASMGIPKEAKPYVPRNPIMITWMGKRVPLSAFIWSSIVAVFMMFLLLWCIIFWFPMWITVIVLTFMAGQGVGKMSRCN